MRLIVLFAVSLGFFSTTYSAPALAKCGENGSKACLGVTCKKKLRKDDEGICRPCGRAGQRACLVNPCPGKDVIKSGGYCMKREAACSGEGQPPCHILKRGRPCQAGLGIFDGICGSCGSDFQRACPREERGNNCQKHLKFHKGVCVPRADGPTVGPATRVFNASLEPVYVKWWDQSAKTVAPGQSVEIAVPDAYCLDTTHAGFHNPDNETLINVPFLHAVLTTECAQWSNVSIWTNEAAEKGSTYKLQTVHRQFYQTELEYLQETEAVRNEEIKPGSSAGRAGLLATVRAPDTDAWVIFWGGGFIDAGRIGAVKPRDGNLGLLHPDQRSDKRWRRLHGNPINQWVLCRPGSPSSCVSEELLDYPVDPMGQLWAYVDGVHMVEFPLRNTEKLVAKRLGLNEARHYRHHNKVAMNRYTNQYGNHYVFTSNRTGYFENGKSGRKTHIRRAKKEFFDPAGLYHGTLNKRPVTFEMQGSFFPNLKKGYKSIRVEEFASGNKKKFTRVDSVFNLYRAEDGETWRIQQSRSLDELEGVWTDRQGKKHVFEKLHVLAGNGGLEGEWKASGDNFEISKQRKNTITVTGLDGKGERKFARISRTARYFEHGGDRIRLDSTGFWVQLQGQPPVRIERQ